MREIKGQKVRHGGSLSVEERKQIIEEYLTTDQTKTEIWKKYTGKSEEHGQIMRWMRMYGYLTPEVVVQTNNKFLPSAEHAYRYMNNPDKADKDLERRVRELEKQLKFSKLQVEGYEIMIDLAEKELNIPIKKKSDTK